MKLYLFFVVAILLAGSMLCTTAMAADAEAYKTALAKAEESICDADSKAQLWTTTDDLLEEAEGAAAAGDFDKAIELVKEAVLHAELAVATAEREKKVWQNSVPK